MMNQNLTGSPEDLATGSLSDRSTERPCESCRVTCRSIHGFVAPPCPVKNCYSCAEIPVIDQEISAAYQHLCNLVQKRTQTIQKRHDEAFIQRLPVEILSMIFLLFKENDMDKEGSDPLESYPLLSRFRIQRHIPHLLVGSICKRWREVSLNMPMLWKDILVDLFKSAESQLWIVDEWARRSSPLPIKLTICICSRLRMQDEVVLDDFENVIKKLRSLSVRWNDLALSVPWSFCRRLLDGLEESLSVPSMYYIQDLRFHSEGDHPVSLDHPLCPRRFFCHFFPPMTLTIPLGWSSLVHLDFAGAQIDDLCNIIGNASNLTRCVVNQISCRKSRQDWPKSPRYITSRSLMHLEADHCLLDYFTLPSLETLKYHFWNETEDPDDLFVEFINRSLPPLQTLYLGIHRWNSRLTSCFGKLSGISQLCIELHGCEFNLSDLLQTLSDGSSDYANVLLPALQELTLLVWTMPGASWSNVSRLFVQDPQPHLPGADGSTVKFIGSFGRPLSKVVIRVALETAARWVDEYEDDEYDSNDEHSVNPQMDSTTFLRLRAIKNSGVELQLRDEKGLSLLDRAAELYNFDVDII